VQLRWTRCYTTRRTHSRRVSAHDHSAPLHVHHAFQVVEGTVEVSIDSLEASRVGAGDLIYVPKDTEFVLQLTSRYAKIYVFFNGGGLVRLLQKLGQVYEGSLLPDKAISGSESRSESVGAEIGLHPLQDEAQTVEQLRSGHKPAPSQEHSRYRNEMLTSTRIPAAENQRRNESESLYLRSVLYSSGISLNL
jgi:hypothetical protein